MPSSQELIIMTSDPGETSNGWVSYHAELKFDKLLKANPITLTVKMFDSSFALGKDLVCRMMDMHCW